MLELTNVKCVTSELFCSFLGKLEGLRELAVKQMGRLDLAKGPANDALIGLLKSNHKTLKVLDLSGNPVPYSLLDQISSLTGLEWTSTSVSRI